MFRFVINRKTEPEIGSHAKLGSPSSSPHRHLRSEESSVPRKKQMAAIRTMTNMLLREFIHQPLLLHSSSKSCQFLLPCLRRTPRIAPIHSNSRFGSIRCAASTSAGSGGDRKVSSRLSQVQQMLHEAEERANSAGNEPTPQITLGKLFCFNKFRKKLSLVLRNRFW